MEAKALLNILAGDLDDEAIDKRVNLQISSFSKTNEKKVKEGKDLLPHDCLERFNAIKMASPRWLQ